jgi:hypothetical protein
MRFASMIVVAVVSCASVHAAEPKLQEKKLLDGKLTVSIPAGFKQLNKELIAKKYGTTNAPTIVFASADGAVSIAVNHTQNKVSLKQIPDALDAAVGAFEQAHPNAEWFRKEATKVNGRDCLILELRSQATDTDIRNVMLGRSLDDRFLIVTFNCTKELEEKWLATGKKIIEGVKVK